MESLIWNGGSSFFSPSKHNSQYFFHSFHTAKKGSKYPFHIPFPSQNIQENKPECFWKKKNNIWNGSTCFQLLQKYALGPLKGCYCGLFEYCRIILEPIKMSLLKTFRIHTWKCAHFVSILHPISNLFATISKSFLAHRNSLSHVDEIKQNKEGSPWKSLRWSRAESAANERVEAVYGTSSILCQAQTTIPFYISNVLLSPTRKTGIYLGEQRPLTENKLSPQQWIPFILGSQKTLPLVKTWEKKSNFYE